MLILSVLILVSCRLLKWQCCSLCLGGDDLTKI